MVRPLDTTPEFFTNPEQSGATDEDLARFVQISPLGEVRAVVSWVGGINDPEQRQQAAETIGAALASSERQFPEAVSEDLAFQLAAHTVPNVHEFTDQ